MISLGLADSPVDANSSGPDLVAEWSRYRVEADRPDRFTRWMLERTLALVVGCGSREVADQAVFQAIEQTIINALAMPPVPSPQAVDSRVDLLALELPATQTLAIIGCFENVLAIPLDDLQLKRKNPWGGFREAWLEHYNQVTRTIAGSGQMADTQVQSEVAGSVWKVRVKEGDTVARDQELMILESMKMEIPVEAPCDGTVASVLVAPEDGVEEDQVLLIITS